MTQSRLKYIVLLLNILVLLILGNYYGPVKAIKADSGELQCNTSNITKPNSNSKYEISCSLNSRAFVKYNAYTKSDKVYGSGDTLDIQFNCYNATPLRKSLPLNMKFPERIDTVQFKSCRFSVKDDILKILKHSLRISQIKTVEFCNEVIESSLSRLHLKPLHGFVRELSFNIKNLSTLPMDLFEDIKTLTKLSIYSNSVNSSYLSRLLNPLEGLFEMVLEINDLKELSGSIFSQKRKLYSLNLRNNTMRTLPTGFLSHLSNLEDIYLRRNYFRLLPNDLFLETKRLKKFVLVDNKVTLKELPNGLLSAMLFLQEVKIISCGLDSIPADIFNGSKKIINIDISANNLHELPLRLFVHQEYLLRLDLSRNKIRTLIEGLFDYNKYLQELNLSDNQLTNLSMNIFKHLTTLNYLHLENNNLLTMSSDNNKPQLGSVFDNLSYLLFLNLKNNSIKHFFYSVMNNNKYLNTIDLSFNNISSINCNSEKYKDSQINLTGNPIKCDCNIICIHQFMMLKPLEENSWLRTIRCEFPSTLKSRLLYDLKLDELLCFPDIHQGNISKRCAYNIRKLDSVLVMNCSNGHFTNIPMLPMFDQSYSNGIELFMDNNPLTELSTKFINENTDITLLSICNSSITVLPKRFISKLAKLKTVLLFLPTLKKISEDIFLESYAIQILKISGTHIKSLPEQIFATQQKLIDLDLSMNRLETFSSNCLASNSNLEILKLSHNFLGYNFSWTYGVLPKLKKIFLDNNRFKYLHKDFLNSHSLPSLEYLNLENNELTNIECFGIHFGTLRTLLLRNNSISDLFSLGLNEFFPSYIDLSLNKIETIDFVYLRSINPKKTALNFTNNNILTFKLRYGKISIYCDCSSFVKYKNLGNEYEGLRCLSPNNLKDHQISYLPQDKLLCHMKTFCPSGCLCWFRLENSTLIVNCSNSSLTEAPSLLELDNFEHEIELFIEHNQLRSLRPHSQKRYKGVTKMYATHNNITKISAEDIPERMTFLDISHNQLERLGDEVIQVITERRNHISILLHHNPLICDCSSETSFILMNKPLFPGTLECGNGQNLSALSVTELCDTDKMIWIAPLIIVLLLFVLTVFYFKNKETILIWMYAHNLCLCCVTEEELDKDKKFDVFISYSSLDADFVALNLLSKLESGPKPYKLCLHDRDWLGGGYIPYQIEKSVDRSRRTLIVMSQNYINSRWTRLEFRTAHNASMNEKRPRVIVVMIDDKVDLKDLDSDLRKYIKMYTYLRWGDAWFWDRLKYALPHPSNKKQDIKKNIVKLSELGNAEAGTGYSSDENELF